MHGHIKRESAVSKKASKTVICALISEIRSCVEETVIVVDAADRLAQRGQAEKALRILMDVEGPTREVQDLFRTVMKVRQTLLPDPQ